MKPNGKAARQHRLSAAASEFQPASCETAVADTAARPSDAAHARAGSRAAPPDAAMDTAAPEREGDEADGMGCDEVEDGAAPGCGGASQADERESEDGRSDRVRLGSAARRCVTALRQRARGAAAGRAPTNPGAAV